MTPIEDISVIDDGQASVTATCTVTGTTKRGIFTWIHSTSTVLSHGANFGIITSITNGGTNPPPSADITWQKSELTIKVNGVDALTDTTTTFTCMYVSGEFSDSTVGEETFTVTKLTWGEYLLLIFGE